MAINFKLAFFILVLIGIAFEIIGDVFLKRWSIENRNYLLGIGLGIYFIGAFFWAMSLKYGTLSKAITVFTVFNLVIVSLIGYFYFNENLSLMNKIGIGLGILSIIFVEL